MAERAPSQGGSRILAELQNVARLSFNELTRRADLSAPSVADRARRLQGTGMTTGTTPVDLARASRGARAIVDGTATDRRACSGTPRVLSWPESQTMHRVAGHGLLGAAGRGRGRSGLRDVARRLSIHGTSTSSLVRDDLLPWSAVLPPEAIGHVPGSKRTGPVGTMVSPGRRGPRDCGLTPGGRRLGSASPSASRSPPSRCSCRR
jgi:Lrp/AsnC family transcriptional regulator, leucine-responsive regulatory protein